MASAQFLLLQIRYSSDPMRAQEVQCFSRAIGCQMSAILPFDLIGGIPTLNDLKGVQAVLIGGSGDYSAADDTPWLEKTLGGLQKLVELRKPTFASCWGFQALARAMGGRCIHDPAHAEVGTIELELTPAGRKDPLFGELPSPFHGQAGHEDHVIELPPETQLLASSKLVHNQAFKFLEAPIYCTQFHPELNRKALLERISAYPQYIERSTKLSLDEFAATCHETPETAGLLRRFAQFVTES